MNIEKALTLGYSEESQYAETIHPGPLADNSCQVKSPSKTAISIRRYRLYTISNTEPIKEFKLKLAVIQPRAPREFPEFTLTPLEAAVADSKVHDVDVVVFPELILPGYNFPKRHHSMAQSLNGEWMRNLSKIAQKYQCAIVLGWAERFEGTVYNSVTALGSRGEILAHYRKRQLFGAMEQKSFAPGRAPSPIFEIAGYKCGLLICYEIEFPEYARDLALRGAEVVIVPTANPVGYEHVQDILVPARAYENRQFVAYVNYCGAQNGLAFSGTSLVAGPDGKALAQAGHEATALYVKLPEFSDYPKRILSTQLDDLRKLTDQSDVPHRE